MVMMLVLILLPVAFLLPPGAGAGEIIGGWVAKPHSRPYMAFLRIQRGQNFHRCGGFLVSKDFVLTAAHCNGEKITVYLGAHNISKREESQQEIPAGRKIPHPQYNIKSLNNDIMLLKLEKKALLNKYVDITHLPPVHQQVCPGTACSVAGWGRTSAVSERLPDTLQEVDLVVMPDDACSKWSYHHYNSSTMLCAGDPKKGKCSFKGDSGGPLMCNGTAQGIVSWGPSNGTPPRVYTRISSFVPWIQEEMKKLQP